MKISLGQYIPGKTPVHKADARTKFLSMIAYMVSVMLIETFIGYGIAAVFVLATYLIARLPMKYIFRSIRPVLFIVIFTMILNLFIHTGHTVWFEWKFIVIYKESVFYCIKIALRVLLLVMGASLLTYTTTSSELTDGIESLLSPLKIIRFPAHDIAMMMSIALRFIPTFTEETDRIMKAQSSRGAEFDTGSFMQKIKSFIPVIIPLIISAFRRAEDLAVAMESRCYRGGKGRTRYRVLKFTWRDAVVAGAVVVFMVGIIVFGL